MGFTLYELFWFFVIYALLGWGVEVCFCSIYTGKFVNRGFLNGPVCPIYGFGMLAIVVCLTPFKDNLILLYIGAVLLTSLLELVTGFVLKKIFHTSWWDYSDVKFNLGGYICLSFSLAWGVGGVLAIKLVHPLVQWFVNFVPQIVGVILAVLVLAAFICDFIVTVNTITKLNRDLGRIDDIAKLMHKGSEAIAENLGNSAVLVSERVDEKMNEFEGAKSAMDARIDVLKADLLDGADFARRRLLQAFPHMKPENTANALAELRRLYDKAFNKDKK
ncbi:MAG: putative ABC transporter permease [Oscillospiraceae bacterium]